MNEETEKILKILKSYRCSFWRDKAGIEIGLIDLLSPLLTIKEGQRELESLADYIAGELNLPEWQPIETAPIRETVIVGSDKRKETGSGWQNEVGYWFVYGTSMPMEKPTHFQSYPDPPK